MNIRDLPTDILDMIIHMSADLVYKDALAYDDHYYRGFASDLAINHFNDCQDTFGRGQ